MFHVNDVIIYGTQGVCRIVGIEEKAVSGAKKNYFVLKPVNDNGSTIYAPTGNEHVLKKMRRLLSKTEINSLIDSMPDEEAEQILYNEFQYVLKLNSKDEMMKYIFSRIEK